MIQRVERHEGAPPEGWDDLVRRLDGSVFHSAAWAAYQRAASGAQPWFLIGQDPSGAAAAGAVAFLRRSPRPILSRLFRSLEAPAHPFGARGAEGDAAAMLLALEELGRSAGCASLHLDSFMSGQSALVPERRGYREHGRVEFVVDLSRTPDELWHALGKDQRERIRKLERLGMAVETGGGRADLDALRLVRGKTHEKRVRRGQSYALTGDQAFYDALHRYVIAPGIGRLFLARTDGVVAALLFAVFHRSAYSMFSGSSEEGYRLGAQSLLFWRAVEQFRSEGVTLLNRGGVPADSEREEHPLHGIYLFKRRLGGTPVLCRSGVKILHPVRHALMGWSGRVRRTLAGGPGEE